MHIETLPLRGPIWSLRDVPFPTGPNTFLVVFCLFLLAMFGLGLQTHRLTENELDRASQYIAAVDQIGTVAIQSEKALVAQLAQSHAQSMIWDAQSRLGAQIDRLKEITPTSRVMRLQSIFKDVQAATIVLPPKAAQHSLQSGPLRVLTEEFVATTDAIAKYQLAGLVETERRIETLKRFELFLMKIAGIAVLLLVLGFLVTTRTRPEHKLHI